MIGILERVAVDCGRLVLSLRNVAMEAKDKTDQLGQHFSTRADRQSQDLGLSILQELLPNEIVIAEEKENASDIPPNCTVFDPLDGTTNYYNGIDDFGVTLCTFRDAEPVYSATYFPVRNMLISAVRDEGCYSGGFKNGTRLSKIPWHGMMDKTQLSTDVGSWTLRHGTFDLILRPLAKRFNILSSMSAIETGRRVLLGQLGGYYNFGIAKIWDAAAMALAIMEAGGVACGPTGAPIKWNTIGCDWVFASNQELAEIILQYSRFWPGRK